MFAEIFCKRCVTCNTHNVARGIKTPLASQPAPAGPFEYLMMDFIELTPCGKQKHCLVMVDMWSKWVEAFPTSKTRFGSSDKGRKRKIFFQEKSVLTMADTLSMMQ